MRRFLNPVLYFMDEDFDIISYQFDTKKTVRYLISYNIHAEIIVIILEKRRIKILVL
jgi:hypothetical protein